MSNPNSNPLPEPLLRDSLAYNQIYLATYYRIFPTCQPIHYSICIKFHNHTETTATHHFHPFGVMKPTGKQWELTVGEGSFDIGYPILKSSPLFALRIGEVPRGVKSREFVNFMRAIPLGRSVREPDQPWSCRNWVREAVRQLMVKDWVHLEGRDINDLLDKITDKAISIRTAVLVHQQKPEHMAITELDPDWHPRKIAYVQPQKEDVDE